MNQFTAKDDNDRLVAFQNILAERKKLELKIATKQEKADKEKNKQILQIAFSHTTDSIVKGLAELQLSLFHHFCRSIIWNPYSTRLLPKTFSRHCPLFGLDPLISKKISLSC